MSNYLEILMIIVAFVLVIVIWSLSSVLSMMAKKVVEFTKSNKTLVILAVTLIGSLYSNVLMAQVDAAALTDSTAVNSTAFYGGLSSTTFWTLGSVIALELLVVFLLVFFIKNLWKVLNPVPVTASLDKKISTSWLVSTWNKLDKQFFTKAAPIEQEADILLDHDYDGIRELDNALPPWWKYGFYITIFVAVLYLLKFEVWHMGQNPTEEYNTEMAEGKAATDAYLASAKENVDEKTVTMSDAAGIAAGKTLFAKTCVACHLANGEGSVGPNLTDEYWLHGGSINDIFKTIKYGWPDKGMQAWASTYSPVQMQQLSSYIRSLKGTNPPNAKAPQGELYKEVATSMDSTSVAAPKTDSATTK